MTYIQDLIERQDTKELLSSVTVGSWENESWGSSKLVDLQLAVGELGNSLGKQVRSQGSRLSRFGDKCLDDIDFNWGRWYRKDESVCGMMKPFLQRILQVGKRDGTWVRINVDTDQTRGSDFHRNMFTIKGQRFNLPTKATKVVSWKVTHSQPLTDELREKFPKLYNDDYKGETHNWDHIDFNHLMSKSSYSRKDILEGLETLGVLVREEHVGQKVFSENYTAWANMKNSRFYCYQEMWIDISQMETKCDGYGYEDLSFNGETVEESWEKEEGVVDILLCWGRYQDSDGHKMTSPDRTYNERTSPGDEYLYSIAGYKEENWTRYGLEKHYWTEKREKERGNTLKGKNQEERLKDFRKDNLIVDEDILRWVKLKIDKLLEMTEEDFHRATEDIYDNKYEIGMEILKLIGDNGYKNRGTERFGDYRRQSIGYQMAILKDVLGKESGDWDYEKRQLKGVK